MGLNIMGVAGALQGAARAVTGVAGAFTPNAEAADARAFTARAGALAQFAAEFQPRQTWFDAVIDGVNRIPRPAMALGTIGLFIWAMMDPIGFAARMQGVALIPEPMWWLMGAIVSFYFGARELQQRRTRSAIDPAAVEAAADSIARIEAIGTRRDDADRVRSTYLTPGAADGADPELDIEAVAEANPDLAALLSRAREFEAGRAGG